ncbi:hypothetical protein BH23THE1_BH23THE1_22550 [soil metagenome]
MKIINSLFTLIIAMGFFFLTQTSVSAYHAPYHDGPSCGQCHCSPDQDCSSDANWDGCECTTPELSSN